jgi:hypothetical protein
MMAILLSGSPTLKVTAAQWAQMPQPTFDGEQLQRERAAT